MKVFAVASQHCHEPTYTAKPSRLYRLGRLCFLFTTPRPSVEHLCETEQMCAFDYSDVALFEQVMRSGGHAFGIVNVGARGLCVRGHCDLRRSGD